MGDYSYAKAADKVKGRPYVYALLVDYIEPSLTGSSQFKGEIIMSYDSLLTDRCDLFT